MKIFKDADNIFQKIAGEMINIECGKKIFENGKQLEPPYEFYPRFVDNGVQTIIRANLGYIYIHGIDSTTVVTSLYYHITKMEQQLGFSPFEERRALETNSKHFTVVKAYVKSAGTDITETINQIYNRKILYNPKLPVNSYFPHAKFIWVIHDTTVLLEELYYEESDYIVSTSQLTSIIYDSTDCLNIADNTSLYSIKFPDFKIYDKIVKVNNNKYKHCKFNMSDIVLGAFHLICLLGNWAEYNWNAKVTLYPLKTKIMREQYDNIKDKILSYCSCCRTPLYDEIYVIKKLNHPHHCQKWKYTAHCPICLHYRLTHPQYFNNKTILRVTYPRTVEDIIDTIAAPEIVRTVIRESFKGVHVEINKNKPIVYIGDKDNPKYIGWVGDLDKLLVEGLDLKEGQMICGVVLKT